MQQQVNVQVMAIVGIHRTPHAHAQGLTECQAHALIKGSIPWFSRRCSVISAVTINNYSLFWATKVQKKASVQKLGGQN